MLFSAAQRPEAQQPDVSLQQQQRLSPVSSAQPHAPTQQTSLHSFWKLPNSQSLSAASAAIASPSVDASIYGPRDCEDCGQPLRDGDDMDVEMTEDCGYGYGAGKSTTGCAGCGKHVCSHCSITNLGQRRRCLGCAGTARKSWVGGIGWISKAPTGLGIC
jgi:hypothetical protein